MVTVRDVCEEDEALEGVVSIRCRRHKRRFNVEEGWLKVCEWLCPHCWEVLKTDEARAKYAPRGREKPEVRCAEAGKPVRRPSVGVAEPTGEGSKRNEFASRLSKVWEALLADEPEGAKKCPVGKVKMRCIYCGSETEVPESYYCGEHMFCPKCRKRMGAAERRRYLDFYMGCYEKEWMEAERRFKNFLGEKNRNPKHG